MGLSLLIYTKSINSYNTFYYVCMLLCYVEKFLIVILIIKVFKYIFLNSNSVSITWSMQESCSFLGLSPESGACVAMTNIFFAPLFLMHWAAAIRLSTSSMTSS